MKINWYKVLWHSISLCGVLWLLAVILLLNACNIVKKSSNKSDVKTESSTITTNDSTRVIKADSTWHKIEEGEYERETIFAYDTIYLQGDTIYQPRYIYIKEKGKYKKEETAAKASTDSGHVNNAANITLKKQESTTTKQTERWALPWWLKLAGIIAIAALAYRAYKQYFT